MTEPDEAIVPTKAELQDELRERELPVSGTKDELIERLAEADAADEEETAEAEEETGEEETVEAAEEEAEAEKPAVTAGLINEAGEHDLKRIAQFGGEARARVLKALNQLEELAAVLADFESHHSDPAAADAVAASRAVRSHIDDARRPLTALAVACQGLQTAASA